MLTRRPHSTCDHCWTNESTWWPPASTTTLAPLVLATGPGNPPAVVIWTTKMGSFDSRPVQKLKPLIHGGLNPDLYPSTCWFRWVWLDPSVPITGSAFWVSYLWSHSDMLLTILRNWHWYIKVYYRCIGRLSVQNEQTDGPDDILKMGVIGASTIVGRVSWVILWATGYPLS